jgi:hypothetical protein
MRVCSNRLTVSSASMSELLSGIAAPGLKGFKN